MRLPERADQTLPTFLLDALPAGGGVNGFARPAVAGRRPRRPTRLWSRLSCASSSTSGRWRRFRGRPEASVSSARLGRPRGAARSSSVLQRGDRLVVSELSRLGQSLGQIVTILDALAKAGAAFVALKEHPGRGQARHPRRRS